MKLLPCARLACLVLAPVLCCLSKGVSAAEKTEAATRQYNVAAALQNRAEYDSAADEWLKFLKEHKADPRCHRAAHYLGVCYLKANKLDLALEQFQTVLKTYPHADLHEATCLHLGITQYTMGQSGKAELYDEAAATFEALLKQYPKGKYLAQALFYRAECFYARGKKKEAVHLYSQFVEKFPNDRLAVDALYALGVSQEEAGDFAAAGKTYDAFLQKFPENPLATEVGMRRGETLLAAKQYKAAAERFAAAAAKPGFPLADHATIRQAACLAQLKQYDEAAALLASVPARFPQSKYLESAVKAAHWAAQDLLKDQKPAESLAFVEKILPAFRQNPLAAQLLMDQADALYEIPERRGESVALYAALAAKYPKDPLAPQALYMAGFTALGQGDYAAALNHVAAFLKAHPDHELAAEVTYVAAESNLQLGKSTDAEKLFDELLEKYPRHADFEAWKVRRAIALQLQKKHDETIAALQPLLKELKTPDVVAEAHYVLGNSQVELKQLDAAAKSFEASLRAAPKWRQADSALLMLARTYGQLQNVPKARASVQKLIADFTGSRLLDQAHYRLAEYSFASGDFKSAAAEYQQVLDKWPDSPLAPHALYGLGWTMVDQKEYAAAEKTLDALVARHADHKLIPRAKYARGIARQQLGNFAAALDDLQAFLAADPSPTEKIDAQYVVGLCLSGLKKPAEAAATFQAIFKEDAKPAIADKVYYELAWALQSQNKEKEAAEAFAKLAEDYPNSPLAAESLYHLGEFAYKGSDFKKAAESYRAALEKAGKADLGEKAAHKLGWAYYRQENYADGQQAFSQQRSDWPDGPLASDAAFMEGECLLKLKKFKEALAAYGQVKSPSSKDFQVLTMLHSAQALGQLKEWKKSLALLVQCAEQFADSAYLPEILYEQGWAQQNLDKLAEATALYEAVVAKAGNREVAARAQFMIGEIEFQQKKHADAVKSYFRVIYGYGFPAWQAEAAYEAARCFEVLGKKDQAAKQYQELIDKFPQSDKVPLAKERLKTLQN